jgi:hypothetical protein
MFHPTYTCMRATAPITITGKADDPQWAAAEVAELTDPITGNPHGQPTTARLLYDDTYLYAAFHAVDTYVWGTFTERDEPIFTEECFEFFICPSNRMRQYYEINVSPRNTVFDTFLLNGNTALGEWKIQSFVPYTCAGLITKTYVDGDLNVPGGARGWSAEYAIPFTSIIGHDHIVPEPGDAWKMNLYRIDQPEKGTYVHYAWATIGKIDFHAPMFFGTMRFA